MAGNCTKWNTRGMVMGSAKIRVTNKLIIDLLGLSEIDGHITIVTGEDETVEVLVLGDDPRLPGTMTYPLCSLKCQTTTNLSIREIPE
jgi:hypothetical protein